MLISGLQSGPAGAPLYDASVYEDAVAHYS